MPCINKNILVSKNSLPGLKLFHVNLVIKQFNYIEIIFLMIGILKVDMYLIRFG